MANLDKTEHKGKAKWEIKNILLISAAAILLTAGTLLLVYRERTLSVIQHLGEVFMSKILIPNEVGVYDGMRMEQGDEIRTGKRSEAVLELDEAKLITLKESTSATFNELSGTLSDNITLVFLKAGTMFNDIAQKLSSDSAYTVNTPNATVSVRGTYFTVTVHEDAATGKPTTVINVYHGSVHAEYIDEAGNPQTLDIVQGQKATIADKTVTTEHKLDFSDFSEEDLRRLIELAQEQSTGYTIEEVEEQYERIVTPINAGMETFDIEELEDPVIEVTAAPLPPVESAVSTESQAEEAEPESSSSTAQSAPASLDDLPQTVKSYAHYPKLNTDMSDVTSAREEYEEYVMQAEQLTSEQKQDIGYEKIQEGLQKIELMESAGASLDAFNALPQPKDVTLANREAIEGAREIWNQLDEDAQQYLPEAAKNKLRDCEEYLAVSVQCAEAIDGLDPSKPDQAALDAAVAYYIQLGGEQKNALGKERLDKLSSLYGKARTADPDSKSESENLKDNSASSAPGQQLQQIIPGTQDGADRRQLTAEDVRIEKSSKITREDMTIHVESEKSKPVQTVADQLDKDLEIAACYDVRLVARNSAGEETEVQPTRPVHMRIQVPDRFGDIKSFLIWHVFGENQIEPVAQYQIERDANGTYLSFSVDHFSQFVVAAPKAETVRENKDVVEATVETTNKTVAGSMMNLLTRKNLIVAVLYLSALILLSIPAAGYLRRRHGRAAQ